jgi:hypothetical protein
MKTWIAPLGRLDKGKNDAVQAGVLPFFVYYLKDYLAGAEKARVPIKKRVAHGDTD